MAPLLKTGLSWPNYLLLAVLVISSFRFAFTAYKLKTKPVLSLDDQLTKYDYFFSTLLLVLTAVVSKIYINKYTVWLDESDAGLNSLVNDMVVSAADYQQPPLDYLYRRWGLLSFGLNEVGLRLSSVVAYGLFIFVTYFNFLKISKNSLLSFSFAALLALNDWVIRYAIEARPYSLGLCYFALFSYFVINILTEEDSPESSSKYLFKQNDLLCFITFFWLMSISMQPFLFVCSSLVVCTVYYLVTKNVKIKKIALQLFWALVIFIPFQLLIVKSSVRYLKNQNLNLDYSIYEGVLQSVQVLFELFTMNTTLTLLFAASLTAIILGLSSTPKKNIVFNLALIFLAYTFVLIGFFALKINWQMNYRYLLLNLVLFYYLVFLATHYYKENAYQFKKNVLILAGILTSLVSLYSYNLNEINQVNWRGLYQTMQQKTVVKADAYIYVFNEADHLGIDGSFMASDFYDTSKLRLRATRGSAFINSAEYIGYFAENSKGEAFIAIDKMTLKPEVFSKVQVDNAELFETLSFFVLYKKEGVPLLKVAEQFLERLDENFPANAKKFRLHLDLFELKILKRDCKEAKKYLEHLSTYKMSALELESLKQKHTKVCS